MGMVKMMDDFEKDSSSHVVVKVLDEPMQVRKMMLDGTADFAILPMTMAALLYNRGIGYSLVSVPVWGTLYLFGSDTTVSAISDLRGKKVNIMAKGMTPDALFRYLLVQNSLVPDKDVFLDYSFPSHIDLANAVAAGRAAMGVVAEPYVSLAMKNNPSVRILLDLESEWDKIHGTGLTQTAFVCSDSIIHSSSGMVKKVEEAYRRSTEWVNTYPDSAAVIIVQKGILPDVPTATHSISRSKLRYLSCEEAKGDVEEYLKVLFELNPDYIGGKMPDEGFYYKK